MSTHPPLPDPPLTLEEKVELLTGSTFWSTASAPAIGLETMVLSDGPAGVRGFRWDEREPSVSFPSPTCQAATWDVGLVERIGEALAAQAITKGVHMVLAPTVNLQRSPYAGRHFEYFSQDPWLAAALGVALVQGLQRHGVAACAKHFVGNDSETDRLIADVRMTERTLREVYLRPFEEAVRAGVWSVMAGYNALGGVTMTEHPLLETVLRHEWGFDGVVVSDWGAVRTTVASASASLDLVMPGPSGPWGAELVTAVRSGAVDERQIDEKVERLRRLAGRVGALAGGAAPRPVPASSSSAELAVDVAAAGTVLLHNRRKALPLAVPGHRRVAVIGPLAVAPRIQGGGSATVLPGEVITPLAGLRAVLGDEVEVSYAEGARADDGLQPLPLEACVDPVSGEPGVRVVIRDQTGRVLLDEHRRSSEIVWLQSALPRGAASIEVTTRYTPEDSGPHVLGVGGTTRSRLVIDGHVVVDGRAAGAGPGDPTDYLDPPMHTGYVELYRDRETSLRACFTLAPGTVETAVRVAVAKPWRGDETERMCAAQLAARADAVVLVVGAPARSETEGRDRAALELGAVQDDLVAAVCASNPNTVVVVNSGGPVLMPWADQVGAIVMSWFPGQGFGTALAEVLTGIREPGGRLPFPWPATDDALPTRPDAGVLTYTEGIHLPYRVRRSAHAAAYPFGHGLGYTAWQWRAAQAQCTGSTPDGMAVVSVRLANVGDRQGAEVVQVYASRARSDVERPDRWLAGFTRVQAAPGEEVVAQVEVPLRNLGHWDGGWQLEPGTFSLAVGASVEDIRLRCDLVVGG